MVGLEKGPNCPNLARDGLFTFVISAGSKPKMVFY